MNVTQKSDWSPKTHHYTDVFGAPASYETFEAVFAISAFGEDREVKMQRRSDTMAFALDDFWGIKRGRAGTKVWMDEITIVKKDDRWVVSAVQGRHCGHRASSVVGWWDRVPEDQKSKR